MTRDILCDSGVLISLTSGCLDNILYYFSEKHGVRFVIPPSVEHETVTRPLFNGLRKHMFSAIRIKDAIDDGVIVVVDAKVQDKAKGIDNVRGLTLRLRNLSGIIKMAGDMASTEKKNLIEKRHIEYAIRESKPIEEKLREKYGNWYSAEVADFGVTTDKAGPETA